MPSHFSRVWGADLRKHGIAHPDPVRAEPTTVEELEPEAHRRPHSQLLTELPGSRLLVRLTDSRCAPDTEFVVPRETGQLLGTPMDEKTTLPIAAHHHADPVQPALPNRVPPIDLPQHTILRINAFHDFIHAAHDHRTH